MANNKNTRKLGLKMSKVFSSISIVVDFEQVNVDAQIH